MLIINSGNGTNNDWRRSNGDDVAGPSGMAGPSTSDVAGSSSRRRNDFDDSLLRQRRNVFDGDEYDAFGTRFDPSRVHRRDDDRPQSLWKEKVGGESARSEVERIKRLYDTRPPSGDEAGDGGDDAEEDDVIPVNPNYVCSYDDERDDHGDDYDVGVDDSTDQAEDEKQQQNRFGLTNCGFIILRFCFASSSTRFTNLVERQQSLVHTICSAPKRS